MVHREAKKKTHVASAVLLSLILISMVCVIGSAPIVSGSPEASGILSYKETDPNHYASLLAGKLLGSFYTALPNGTGVLIYPLEYAGAYIDSSNNLHIVLSEYATNTTIDTYRSIMGDPDVIFETAIFPLSHLDTVQSALNGVMLKFDIACTARNETANKIDIHMRNSTNQEVVIEYLQTVFNDFDDRCISFKDDPVNITYSDADSSPLIPQSESNDGFLGTNLPTAYGAAAVAILLLTTALGCMLLGFHTAKGKATGA